MNFDGIYREATSYEGLYKYYAPEGYRFWVDDTCYGSIIYGMDKLENNYVLRKINN